MLRQLWKGEALGIDASDLVPTRPEETGTIGSVVRLFLLNDSGFSDEDVASFINTALQNEAADLWRGRVESLMAIEIWRRHVESATGGFEDVGSAEAARRLDVMIQEDSTQYKIDCTGFGEALLMTIRSERVSLAPETCEWATKLNHDKPLTGSTDVDVKRQQVPIHERKERI